MRTSLPRKVEFLLARRLFRRADVVDHFAALPPPLGASRATVKRWLRGEGVPDLRQAAELARFLGTSVDFLARDELDAEPEVVPGPSGEVRFLLELAGRIGVGEAVG